MWPLGAILRGIIYLTEHGPKAYTGLDRPAQKTSLFSPMEGSGVPTGIGISPRGVNARSTFVHPSLEGAGDKVGVSIKKGRARPSDTVGTRRPDAEDRALMWDGEPPPFDEAGLRHLYDLNEELADNLRGRVTIKVGPTCVK